MQIAARLKCRAARLRESAFTLAEVVMALAIIVVMMGGMILGYLAATRRTEWSGYSLAAQAMAIQQLEQARSATWDILSVPAVCEITNIPTVTWTNLDIPFSGTNYTRATNYTTIKLITNYTAPLITTYMVKVDTAWTFRGKTYTNSIANFYAPDR